MALIVLATSGGVRRAWAQQDWIDLEYQKKAQYLIYFGMYVEWPAGAVPGADDRLIIGILGQDPFGAHLRAFDGRIFNERRIVVHRFASMDQYRPCHLLFVSGRADPRRPWETPQHRLQAALERVGDDPVLIVSESPRFADRGAMINFVADVRSRLIRMEVNLAAARRVGLEISARLLNLTVVTVREENAQLPGA